MYCFSFFYFVLQDNFQVQAPPPPRGGGAYVWMGDLKEDFLRYEFGGLIFGIYIWGAYTWRGLFSEFYGKTQTPTDLRKGNAEHFKNILKRINQ